MLAKVDADFAEIRNLKNVGITIGSSCLSFMQREIQGTSVLVVIFKYGNKFNFQIDNHFVTAEFLQRMHQTTIKLVESLRRY
jgi:hypothetical protein